MTLIILALAITLLVLAEKYGTPASLESLRFRGNPDKILVEPGETVTWESTVENHKRMPVPFVRLQLRFPAEATLLGSTAWIFRHKKTGLHGWYAEEKFSLGGRQSSTRKLRFSLTKRGVYPVAEARLGAGDLLGLQEKAVYYESQKIVVMPERSTDALAIQALGGFLGDMSVKRFIFEDPILTVGFRDYTGQEPLKSISWTRTAAAGSLQVRQFDHTAERNAVVLLDTSDGTAEELERCYEITRTVCETLEKDRIPFSFRTNGRLSGPAGNLFYLPEGLGTAHLNAVLYGLGGAEHVCYYSRKRLVQQALDSRKSNDAFIVIMASSGSGDMAPFRRLQAASTSPVCFLMGKEAE